MVVEKTQISRCPTHSLTISVDLDQMLHSAASDPGLHCLSMYYLFAVMCYMYCNGCY